MSAATAIKCNVPGCGHTEADWLGDHLVEAHGMSVDAYQAAHPGKPVMSDRLRKAHEKGQGNVRRAHPPAPETLTVKFAGLPFKVNAAKDDAIAAGVDVFENLVGANGLRKDKGPVICAHETTPLAPDAPKDLCPPGRAGSTSL